MIRIVEHHAASPCATCDRMATHELHTAWASAAGSGTSQLVPSVMKFCPNCLLLLQREVDNIPAIAAGGANSGNDGGGGPGLESREANWGRDMNGG